MRKRGIGGWLVILILILLSASAAGETAREITADCRMTPASKKKEFAKALDGNYRTFWNSSGGKGAAVELKAPAGEEIGAVWFQWYEHPHAAAVQVKQDGKWTDVAATKGEFLSECLILPGGITECRIANPATAKRNTPLPIAELHVYGRGDLPENVQCWEPSCEKADLLLLAGHPDDELLWFGGILPTYAGVQEKEVQVCIMVPTLPRRRLEELDGLWTCGVRNYPVFGYFRDSFSLSAKDQYSRWGEKAVQKLVTEWIRRFKPDVIITHDFEGEYGHGAHQVCADAVVKSLGYAADAKKFPESAKAYGIWDVPKCYIHLYPEGQIRFDWRVPLERFGGKTAFDVASEAFYCHVSQRHTSYMVEDSGPCDCSLFGLYRSLVGPDEKKNDLFEHLPMYLVAEE